MSRFACVADIALRRLGVATRTEWVQGTVVHEDKELYGGQDDRHERYAGAD